MATITVWVLNSCIPGQPSPLVPTVYGSESAAIAGLESIMQAEWDTNGPEDDETGQRLPYPGNADAAQRLIAEHRGESWGRWELTTHHIEAP